MKTLSRLSFALLVLFALLFLALFSQAQTNRPTGAVVSWGTRFLPYVEPGTRYTAIAAGGGHTVALKTNGTVVAWGYNRDWDGNVAGQTNVPAGLSGVTAIAAGAFHTVALKGDDSVVAWGDNTYGQTDVPVAAQSGVVAIAAGQENTVALKTNGAVVVWGDNQFGNSTVPVGLPPAFAIAAGFYDTLALVRDPPPSLTILRNADQTMSLSWTGSPPPPRTIRTPSALPTR